MKVMKKRTGTCPWCTKEKITLNKGGRFGSHLTYGGQKCEGIGKYEHKGGRLMSILMKNKEQ